MNIQGKSWLMWPGGAAAVKRRNVAHMWLHNTAFQPSRLLSLPRMLFQPVKYVHFFFVLFFCWEVKLGWKRWPPFPSKTVRHWTQTNARHWKWRVDIDRVWQKEETAIEPIISNVRCREVRSANRKTTSGEMTAESFLNRATRTTVLHQKPSIWWDKSNGAQYQVTKCLIFTKKVPFF